MMVTHCVNCGVTLYKDSSNRWADEFDNLVCSTLGLHKARRTK